jgi:hypothetical protein
MPIATDKLRGASDIDQSWRKLPVWAWIVAAVVIAAGGLLRFQGHLWDGGLMLHPDERNIVEAAARLSLQAQPVPDFHAYNGLAVYGPRLAAELEAVLTGTAPPGKVQILLAGRFLSALLSTATIVVVWLIAARLFAPAFALLALSLTAFSPGLIQAAHFGTTESALVFFLCVLILLSVRHLQGYGSEATFTAASAVTLAFAFGHKTTALSFAIIPAVTLLQTVPLRQWGLVTIKSLLIALPLFLLLAVICTPQLVTDSASYIRTMQFEAGVVSGANDVFWTYQFQRVPSVLFEMLQMPWLAGLLVVVTGLTGMLVIAWQATTADGKPGVLWPAVCFAVLYMAIIFFWHAKFVRYLLPLVPILVLTSVALCVRLRQAGWNYVLAAALLATTIAPGMLQGTLYARPDPRVEAGKWLLGILRPEDTVLLESYDVGLPFPKKDGLPAREIIDLHAVANAAKTEKMAEQLARAGWIAIVSRRHYRVLPYLDGRFPAVCNYYRALFSGQLGYELARTFKRLDLPKIIDPGEHAEETFTVFDSPTVMLFRNTRQMTVSQIGAILHDSRGCKP